MTNTIKIQTGTGVYELKKPGGRLGAKNMVLLSKMATAEGIQKIPEDANEDPQLIAKIKAQNAKVATEKMAEVFEEWAPLMIPQVVVSGPFTYDDMPGEDQLAIFMALSQETKIAEDFFRVLPPVAS
jgi:hypothetical protein